MKYHHPSFRLLVRVITLGLRGRDSSHTYLSPEGMRSDKVTFRGSTYWWVVNCPALRLG